MLLLLRCIRSHVQQEASVEQVEDERKLDLQHAVPVEGQNYRCEQKSTVEVGIEEQLGLCATQLVPVGERLDKASVGLRKCLVHPKELLFDFLWRRNLTTTSCWPVLAAVIYRLLVNHGDIGQVWVPDDDERGKLLLLRLLVLFLLFLDLATGFIFPSFSLIGGCRRFLRRTLIFLPALAKL